MANKVFRSVKTEVRILGVDDGYFIPHTKGKCEVVGVVFRGGYWLDGVMHTQIDIDGMDATEKIAMMVSGSPHYGQLRVIMLNGITFAGFNVVDTLELFELTDIPIIAVTKTKPNFKEIRKALKNLPYSEERWKRIGNKKSILEVRAQYGESIFIHVSGMKNESAREIVRKTSTRSSIPEALRVAHLIASGVTTPL